MPGGDESALARVDERLRLPAVGLLITGALGWAMNAFSLVMTRIMGPERLVQSMTNLVDMMPPGQDRERLMESVAQLGTPEGFRDSLIQGFVALVMCTLIMIGAINMRYRRRRGLAILSCILAMVNLNQCCCVIGLPLGIWGLIVLLNPEVARAFE